MCRRGRPEKSFAGPHSIFSRDTRPLLLSRIAPAQNDSCKAAHRYRSRSHTQTREDPQNIPMAPSFLLPLSTHAIPVARVCTGFKPQKAGRCPTPSAFPGSARPHAGRRFYVSAVVLDMGCQTLILHTDMAHQDRDNTVKLTQCCDGRPLLLDLLHSR